MGNGPSPKQIAPWPEDEPRGSDYGGTRKGAGAQGLLVGLLGTALAAAAFVLAPAADARLTSADTTTVAARADAVPPPTSLLAAPPTAPGSTVALAPVTTSAAATTAPFRITTTTAEVTTTSPPTTAENTTTTRPPTTTSTTTATTTTVARSLIVRDISTSKVDSGASWIAVATVSVAEQSGAVAAQAPVSLSWSTGATGQCTTDPSGKCTIYLPALTVPQVALTMISPSPGISRTITR